MRPICSTHVGTGTFARPGRAKLGSAFLSVKAMLVTLNEIAEAQARRVPYYFRSLCEKGE
jgi:hypothetical protein